LRSGKQRREKISKQNSDVVASAVVSGLVSENLYVDASESEKIFDLRVPIENRVLLKFQVAAIEPNRQGGSVNRPYQRARRKAPPPEPSSASASPFW
jgi:hypothetical protein